MKNTKEPILFFGGIFIGIVIGCIWYDKGMYDVSIKRGLKKPLGIWKTPVNEPEKL